MATILQCDACGTQADASGRDKDEWSLITLAKHTNQATPFVKDELCKSCTAAVRRLLQQLNVREGGASS